MSLSTVLITAFATFILLLPTCSVVLANSTVTEKCSTSSAGCSADKDGVILPAWRPFGPSNGDKVLRGIVYLLALCYMFLGVAIVADKFMAAIEVITSKEKDVVYTNEETGEKHVVSVRIWNETVSNLTLMALGSSAPEILLSVIEVVGNNFQAGDLGPGTIVGSAAFNLFCIIAICVIVIPDGEIRRIKHLRVFVCTASFSVLAYIWLYLIIAAISPDEVEVWEALLTFAFFPILVILAYIADKRLLIDFILRKKYKAEKADKMENENGHYSNDHANDIEMGEKKAQLMNGSNEKGDSNHRHEAVSEQEESKKQYVAKLQQLRVDNPEWSESKVAQQAALEILSHQKKSRAYYRVATTRKMAGMGDVVKHNLAKRNHAREHDAGILGVIGAETDDEHFTRVAFDPPHYTVMENVGHLIINVQRIPSLSSEGESNNLDFYTWVDYKTVDGSAKKVTDYEYQEGVLMFEPKEESKTITLKIIDDEDFEEDEHFKVVLSNIRNSREKEGVADKSIDCLLSEKCREALVTILDDDHQGVFSFESELQDIHENDFETHLKVTRSTGARGEVHVPYKTIEASARDKIDFKMAMGELVFENNETEKVIKVQIVDKEEYSRNETFGVELGHPKRVKSRSGGQVVYEQDFDDEDEDPIKKQGRPKLGSVDKCWVRIIPSREMKSVVDQLMKDTNMGQVLSSSSWRDQFIEAVSVSAGGDDDDDSGADAPPKSPSKFDYIMHFLTVFWKVLFAFVPPTDILGGYACFVVSIFAIGLMTALIGDLASHFGCTVGLKDAVTAISLVALGTSLPDTFASKTAAVGDDSADASIGNVTGSNAVNVFLGIGVAWTVAAVYHAIKGTPGGFMVDPGSLGFSVTVFCVLAVVCIMSLFVRRIFKPIGGELGGPKLYKWITGLFFFSLWLTYLILSSLVAYCVIEGF